LNRYGGQQIQRQGHYSTVGLSLYNRQHIRTDVLLMKIPPSIKKLQTWGDVSYG